MSILRIPRRILGNILRNTEYSLCILEYSSIYPYTFPMDYATPSYLKTLQALGTLADAGVGDEALGKAVREWLKAQNIAGAPSPAPHQGATFTDVNKRPSEPPEWARAAQNSTLQGSLPFPAPGPSAPASFAAMDSGTLSITVKVQVDGKAATTVKIPLNMWQALVQLPSVGSEPAARQTIRELAKKAPHSESLTVWMRSQVQQLLGKLQ